MMMSNANKRHPGGWICIHRTVSRCRKTYTVFVMRIAKSLNERMDDGEGGGGGWRPG